MRGLLLFCDLLWFCEDAAERHDFVPTWRDPSEQRHYAEWRRAQTKREDAG